jgi:hypothetical protein
LAIAARAGAQIVETPVPFDSGAKVRSVTPALVGRLALGPPVWPVAGDFVQARLYSVSGGGTVLAVERANGQIERYILAVDEVAALRSTIEAALLTVATSVPGERPSEATVSARRAFARNQMILATIVHGPLMASFGNDGKTATALYLLSVGASFFIVNDLAWKTNVTHTQNAMATDGTIRGAAAATGLLVAFSSEELERRVYSAVGLAGAIGGAKIGFEYARRLTEAEAQAARKLSTLGAAFTLGTLGTVGMFDESLTRPMLGAGVAGGVVGYLLGPAYPRRASYNITAGDVRLLPVGALLGAAAGLTPVIGNDNPQVLLGATTIGGAVGTLLMDRVVVRQYDYSNADATQLWLATLAGGLLGTAAAVLSEPSPEMVLGMVTLGSFFGAIGGHNLAAPELGRPRGASRKSDEPSRLGGARWRFDPAGAALAASRMPGNYPVVRLTF